MSIRSLLVVSLACLLLSILTFQTVNGSPAPEANPQWGGHHGGGHYGGGHHGGGHHWGGSRGHHWG